jgi:predicted NUDIX family NTP pyrophosphohydrolase
MAKPTSAGLLMCRHGPGGLEFLLAHPGGPIFAKRDEGWWTIPKGLPDPGEDLLTAARREFAEETGFGVHASEFFELGSIVQKSGKEVVAWAFWGDCDPKEVSSNLFEMEWPPRSGKIQRFPEVDRVGFFDQEDAKRKLLPAQAPLIDRACELLSTQ